MVEEYQSKYTQIKSNRQLKVLLNHGCVHMTLSFKDREQSFAVTPVQAAVIGYFEQKG
jgi:hypothetical protein